MGIITKDRTTIQITKKLRKELAASKKYPRETFDDQISRLKRLEERLKAIKAKKRR